MKHLLNNMSESEKRAIREQHEGGMRIDTSRFRSLLESTVGNVKPLIMEEIKSDLLAIITSKKTQGCDEVKKVITGVLKSNQITSENLICKNTESEISATVEMVQGLLDEETMRCYREAVLEYCKTAPKVFPQPTIEKQIDWKEIDELTALKYSKDPNYEVKQEPFMNGNMLKYKFFYKSKF